MKHVLHASMSRDKAFVRPHRSRRQDCSTGAHETDEDRANQSDIFYQSTNTP